MKSQKEIEELGLDYVTYLWLLAVCDLLIKKNGSQPDISWQG